MLFNQPQVGAAKIDWSNPITRGLEWVSITPGPRPSLQGPGTAQSNPLAVEVKQRGLTTRFNGADYVSTGAGVGQAAEGTVLVMHQSTILPPNGPKYTHILASSTGTNGSNYFGWILLLGNGTGFLQFQTYAASSSSPVASASGSTPLNDGRPHVSLATWASASGSVLRIYLDGAPHGASGSSSSATAFQRSPRLGGAIDSFWGPFDGNMYVAATWNRRLTDAEARAVSANPWQLFQGRSRTITQVTGQNQLRVAANSGLSSELHVWSAIASIFESIGGNVPWSLSEDAPNALVSLTSTDADDKTDANAVATETAALSLAESADASSATASASLVAIAANLDADGTSLSQATALTVVSSAVSEADDLGLGTLKISVVAYSATTEAAEIPTATATSDITIGLSTNEATDSFSATTSAQSIVALDQIEADDGATGAAIANFVISTAKTDEPDLIDATAATSLTCGLAVIEAGDILVGTLGLLASIEHVSTGANDSASATLRASTGGGATPDEIWSFVFSNGLSAEQTAVQTHQMLQMLTAGSMWATAIEGGYSAADLLRITAAVAAGRTHIAKLGAGNAHVEFDAVDRSGVRVAAEMTGSERTNVTLTP